MNDVPSRLAKYLPTQIEMSMEKSVGSRVITEGHWTRIYSEKNVEKIENICIVWLNIYNV